MFKFALVCMGLIASTAHAETLTPDAYLQPPPIPVVKSIGVGEAENATNAAPPKGEDASSASTAVSPSSRNAKSDEPDQNCQALASAAAAHDLPLEFFVRL